MPRWVMQESAEMRKTHREIKDETSGLSVFVAAVTPSMLRRALRERYGQKVAFGVTDEGKKLFVALPDGRSFKFNSFEDAKKALCPPKHAKIAHGGVIPQGANE